MPREQSVTTVDLLRHAECEGGEIIRGTTDVRLTETGWQRMQRIIDYHGETHRWDHIISSPLQRCRLLSEHISRQRNIPLTIKDGLREMHYGDWEGKERELLWKTDGGDLRNFFQAPLSFPPPNGENLLDFQARVVEAWKEILNDHRGKNILIVQHGGSIRMLLSHLLAMPINAITRLHIPYSCFSRIHVSHNDNGDHVHLIFHNRPHPEELPGPE